MVYQFISIFTTVSLETPTQPILVFTSLLFNLLSSFVLCYCIMSVIFLCAFLLVYLFVQFFNVFSIAGNKRWSHRSHYWSQQGHSSIKGTQNKNRTMHPRFNITEWWLKKTLDLIIAYNAEIGWYLTVILVMMPSLDYKLQ